MSYPVLGSMVSSLLLLDCGCSSYRPMATLTSAVGEQSTNSRPHSRPASKLVPPPSATQVSATQAPAKNNASASGADVTTRLYAYVLLSLVCR